MMTELNIFVRKGKKMSSKQNTKKTKTIDVKSLLKVGQIEKKPSNLIRKSIGVTSPVSPSPVTY